MKPTKKFGILRLWTGAPSLWKLSTFFSNTLRPMNQNMEQLKFEKENERMGTRAIIKTQESDLTLRKTPNPKGDSIVRMPKGSTVEVICENGDWANVRFLAPEKMVSGEPKRVSHVGWCHKDFLQFR